MNKAIECLLLQIATMCLHITAKGQVLASCDITGHTATVYVVLLKGDTDFYSDGGIKAGLLLRTAAQYELKYDWLTPAEQHAQCVRELEAVVSQLMPYLQTEQQEAA